MCRFVVCAAAVSRQIFVVGFFTSVRFPVPSKDEQEVARRRPPATDLPAFQLPDQVACAPPPTRRTADRDLSDDPACRYSAWCQRRFPCLCRRYFQRHLRRGMPSAPAPLASIFMQFILFSCRTCHYSELAMMIMSAFRQDTSSDAPCGRCLSPTDPPFYLGVAFRFAAEFHYDYLLPR